MMTSDLRPKVEIQPFRACAMKNMQYDTYYRNSSVIADLAMGRYHVPQIVRISSLIRLPFSSYKNSQSGNSYFKRRPESHKTCPNCTLHTAPTLKHCKKMVWCNAHDTLAGNSRWIPAQVSGASCNKICASFQR